MSKYLVQANYVGDGAKGLLKDGGSKRHEVVEKLAKSLGGNVDSFYYALGDIDLYLIVDFPDHAAATAFALTVTATGTVTCKTTVLLTPEEIDEVAKKKPSYSPPGK